MSLKTVLFALLVFSIAVPVTLTASGEEPVDAEIMITDSLKIEDSVSVKTNSSMVMASSNTLKSQLVNITDIIELSCSDSEQFLMLKQSDQSPTCVSFSSKEKLIERGWGIAIPIDDLADIEQIKIRNILFLLFHPNT